MSLYRRETHDLTVLALSAPDRVDLGTDVSLPWTYLGRRPHGYAIRLTGQMLANDIRGDSYRVDGSRLKPGQHVLELTALGNRTFFDLNREGMTVRSKEAQAVTSKVDFTVRSR